MTNDSPLRPKPVAGLNRMGRESLSILIIFVKILLGISVTKRRVLLTITHIGRVLLKISHTRLVAGLFED